MADEISADAIHEPQGMQVFEKDEPLTFTEGGHEFLKEVLIPSIGRVVVSGSRAWMPSATHPHPGIKIQENGITTLDEDHEPEEVFEEDDLYLLSVTTSNASRSLLECTLTLNGELFKSDMYLEEDFGDDPMEKNLLCTSDWRYKDDQTERVVYIPADPKLLSQMRFSFQKLDTPKPTE